MEKGSSHNMWEQPFSTDMQLHPISCQRISKRVCRHPSSSCHLNHSDRTLALRAKTMAVCQNIEF